MSIKLDIDTYMRIRNVLNREINFITILNNFYALLQTLKRLDTVQMC